MFALVWVRVSVYVCVCVCAHCVYVLPNAEAFCVLPNSNSRLTPNALLTV